MADLSHLPHIPFNVNRHERGLSASARCDVHSSIVRLIGHQQRLWGLPAVQHSRLLYPGETECAPRLVQRSEWRMA